MKGIINCMKNRQKKILDTALNPGTTINGKTHIYTPYNTVFNDGFNEGQMQGCTVINTRNSNLLLHTG